MNSKNDLDELQRAYNYFAPKQSYYDAIDTCIFRINSLVGRDYFFLSLLGICITIGGLIILYLGSIFNTYMPGILFSFIGIFMLILKAVNVSSDRNMIATLQCEINRMSNELGAYYVQYPNCPLVAKYCRPATIKTLREYIVSGRADSIKEALNLWEMERHNDEMKMIALKTQAIAIENMYANYEDAVDFWR